jgi:hypothetical protein
MTDSLPPSSVRPASEHPCHEETNYAVGYGRPPKATRFKPGKSGNPKGRPKGSVNTKALLKKIYTGKVVMRDGEKRRRVMRIEALLFKQWERGIKGDERAAQAAFETAKDLGVLDSIEAANDSRGGSLTDEMVEALSDEELEALIKLAEMEENILKKHKRH